MTAPADVPRIHPEPTDRRGSLARALAQVQAALPVIGKNNVGVINSAKANYKYTYADLADVTAAVLPALGAHGLAWTALPTTTVDGRFVLRYSLMHTSGETLNGEYPLPDPRGTPPQQLGSAITYARRYTLCSATGVAPADDDDDAAATQGRPASHHYEPAPRPQPEPPAEDQPPPRNWDAAIKAAVDAGDANLLRKLWHEARDDLQVREKITAASKRLEAQQQPTSPAGDADQKRQKHMHALLREAEVTDRADRLHLMAVILNRGPIKTSTELTTAEVGAVIDKLKALKSARHEAGLAGAVTDLLNEHELRQMAADEQDGGES